MNTFKLAKLLANAIFGFLVCKLIASQEAEVSGSVCCSKKYDGRLHKSSKSIH